MYSIKKKERKKVETSPNFFFSFCRCHSLAIMSLVKKKSGEGDIYLRLKCLGFSTINNYNIDHLSSYI